MELPRIQCLIDVVRLYWNSIWKLREWRRGTAAERRELEIRFCLARTLRHKRRKKGLTQQQLAERLNAAQSSISRIERASRRGAIDLAIRALIALGCSDEEIAEAFNAGARRDVQILRSRGTKPGTLPVDQLAGLVGQRTRRAINKALDSANEQAARRRR